LPIVPSSISRLILLLILLAMMSLLLRGSIAVLPCKPFLPSGTRTLPVNMDTELSHFQTRRLQSGLQAILPVHKRIA
jgi:hypothetical protein